VEQNVEAQKTDMISRPIMSELPGVFLSIPRKNISGVMNVIYSYIIHFISQIITPSVWDPKGVHVVELSYLTGIIKNESTL
jgi:hypothetical protein